MRGIASACAAVVLCAGTFFFACGSSDDSAAPSNANDSGSDGASSADSTSDVANGCGSLEATNDGGCVPVAPAGSRILAMEVNPPTSLDYAAEVDVASGIGVHVVPITLPWSALERAAPDAGTSEIDPSLFVDLSAVYSSRPISLLVSIPLVDTAAVLAPPDLAPQLTAGTLAFDDATVISRYEKVVDVMFATFGSSVKLAYFLVANEENLYLASKPNSQWTALSSFYAAIKSYVATKNATVTVGMNLSFGGLLDSTQKAKLTTLFSSSPDVFVSYYLGDNGFGSVSSTTVPADIDTMIAFAGTRPLVLKELGYATGTTGHDPAGQVSFITDLFQAWDAHASQIPMATISRMYDGNISDCTAQAQSYGQGSNQDFIQFLCTLGVRQIDDTPKPAWARLTDAASRRSF